MDQLRHYTSITDMDHANMSYEFIKEQVKSSRNSWKACKKKSAATHHAFFSDRADLMAMKLRTSHKKALQAIMKAEMS